MKFDPTMPKNLLNHFKEIEQKIVTETAWQNGSPVVEIIKQLVKHQTDSEKPDPSQDKVLQPYNMFFKRLLQLSA
jgi:hypothetical protein